MPLADRLVGEEGRELLFDEWEEEMSALPAELSR